MAKSQIRQYVFVPGTANNGKIYIQGKYDLSQILLITDTTNNTILYNFADATYSGTTVTFSRANDLTNNYYSALDASDGITTVTLAVDTNTFAGHALQILYERPEQLVRMPEVGTDAFERTRVANPQSMLDADFEYGLQPTKWLTYDLMRGYPSIYEVPGTDQAVLTVTTDASATTGGTGESLITVINSVAFPASWTVGTPITVKGYLNTVTGFARAEGSFLINSISGSTLTYYAKAKVGTANGDILSTTYTQLRQGNFYTGSSVGTASYSITTNAAAVGTSTAATIATSGTTVTGTISGTTLTTSAGSPAIGQVLTGGGVLPGTYIVSGASTTWVVSASQIISASTVFTATTNTFTTTSGITGTFAVGQVLSGTNVPNGCVIIVSGSSTAPGVFTGTGSNAGGTYAVLTGAAVSSTTIVGTTNSSITTVTFGANHGFIPGDTIISQITSDAPAIQNHALLQGPFFVESVPSLTTLIFTARSAGQIAGSVTGVVYGRPDAFFSHRPFDGGVMLGTGGPSHGSMAVRMSKKYIRYQSGKAVNYNTGALFAPNYDIRSITAGGTTIGSTVTVTTDDTDHNLQPGAQVTILGVTTSGYNGTYTVATIVDERSFTFLATSVLGGTTAAISSPCLVQVAGWWGATVRAGTFDEQNGMFWQWDGQQMAIGRRSSTFQISGSIAINADSNTVTGTNTRFFSQLQTGDRVVIRGMTHVVSYIASDTSLTVTPDYRGATNVTGVKMVKTIDRLVPQSQWNVDRCDGSNGPFNASGYSININKMQMIGLQWTWYGAGFIDWMIRGPDGKYMTVHRLRGNNLNTEAYMRSGNQPVRYEVVNEGARSALTADPGSAGTTLALADVTYFPTPSASYPGYVYCDGEIISYTGKTTGAQSINALNNQVVTAGTLTGCTRAATLPVYVSGSTRNFTGMAAAARNVGVGVVLIGQTATPSISHWGSAFLQDGGFDTDRGYIFNYQSTNTQISTRKTTAFAIRLAPSVSNAIVGDLGTRELINRAQLLLQTIEITAGGTANTNSALVIEGILNPSNYPSNPVTGITWNSLNSTALQTGQPSFSQIAAGTSVTFANTASNSPILGQGGLAIGSSVITVSAATGILVGDDVFYPASTSAVYGGTKVTGVATTASSITGSVTAGTACTFTASISGNILTVTSAPSGGTGIGIGFVLTGGATTTAGGGTFIVGNITGTATSASSSWYVNTSQVVTSQTITATPWVLTDGTHTSGTIVLGQALSGGSLAASTFVTATQAQNSAYTGTGVNVGGTYLVSYQAGNVSSTAMTGTVVQVGISAPLAVAQTVSSQINFTRNTYAQPGETVFSFISSPANKDSLDLTPFKELTNTPIGGRGTFPNGPDVLFINVYLTQGSPVLANLVLRWGEAQA
jgi:hypothetical protein